MAGNTGETQEDLQQAADALLCRLSDSVLDYCADAIDAIESCLIDSGIVPEERSEEVQTILDTICRHLLQSAQQSMFEFKQTAHATCLYIPPAIPQPPTEPHSGDQEVEHSIDKQLEEARGRLTQVMAECATLQKGIKTAEVDIAASGGPASREALQMLKSATSVSALEDMEAVAVAARALRPLAVQAETLLAQRLASGARLGGAGVRDMKQLDDDDDLEAGEVAAELFVRQVNRQAGVSADELRGLRGMMLDEGVMG